MSCPWTFGVTGYGFGRQSFEQIAATCGAAGIRLLEGAPPMLDGRSEAQIEGGIAELRSAGVTLDTFHLPFDTSLDIASFYRTVRRTAVDELKRWIVRTRAAGAGVGILHPSTSDREVDTEGLDLYVRALGASLQELLPFASDHGVILALENMLPGEGSRFASMPEHLEHIHREFAHPNLGFCLDTGHALVAGGPEGAHRLFEAMQGALVAFHLSDTSGDRDIHIAPGRGLVNWTEVFQGAARTGYNRSMCIETAPFAHAVRHCFAVGAWRTLLQETTALAERALASIAGWRDGSRGSRDDCRQARTRLR
jgi:sugar phosphate isomerase/epimerase